MDGSDQLFETTTTTTRDRFNKVKLFLISIYNPTKAERLTVEEFDYEHRSYVILVLTVWKVKMLVILVNAFTCLMFTINFSKASYFLTSLLAILMPYIDKYTWLRYIVNGFLTNEEKYFNYFFITFGIHILIFFAWSAGLLWNSIGWYLLVIDPKNYGTLLSSIIIVNSMLLTVYLLLICALFVKLITHIKMTRSQFTGNDDNEFQRLIPTENNDCVEV